MPTLILIKSNPQNARDLAQKLDVVLRRAGASLTKDGSRDAWDYPAGGMSVGRPVPVGRFQLKKVSLWWDGRWVRLTFDADRVDIPALWGQLGFTPQGPVEAQCSATGQFDYR